MNGLVKAALLAKKIQDDAREVFLPPAEGMRPESERVLPFSIFRGTRGYIEKTVHQINGTYENGWYDACAVMIRRLVETLIIETFESRKIDHKIKGPNGDFLSLDNLINATLKEPSFNLGRDAKRGLKKIKKLGDLSAHNRRYVAHRPDIDKIIGDLRVISQELLFLANLK